MGAGAAKQGENSIQGPILPASEFFITTSPQDIMVILRPLPTPLPTTGWCCKAHCKGIERGVVVKGARPTRQNGRAIFSNQPLFVHNGPWRVSVTSIWRHVSRDRPELGRLICIAHFCGLASEEGVVVVVTMGSKVYVGSFLRLL